MSADVTSRIDALTSLMEPPQMISGGMGMEARAQTQIHAAAVSRMGLPMITSLELGELREPDEHRPSLILCRPGGRSLWELAKASGSTMDEIHAVNEHWEDDGEDRMILIPVS